MRYFTRVIDRQRTILSFIRPTPSSTNQEFPRLGGSEFPQSGPRFELVSRPASVQCILVPMLDLDCGQDFDPLRDEEFFASLPARPGVFLLAMRDSGAQ